MNVFEMPGTNLDQEIEEKKEKKERRERKNILTKELVENQENIPFPGIDPKSYEEIKAFEEEFPGFVTPIDEIIQRMRNEGMKVSFGANADSGNMVFLPYGSDDIKYDSILPKNFEVSDSMNEKVRELIMLSKV